MSPAEKVAAAARASLVVCDDAGVLENAIDQAAAELSILWDATEPGPHRTAIDGIRRRLALALEVHAAEGKGASDGQ